MSIEAEVALASETETLAEGAVEVAGTTPALAGFRNAAQLVEQGAVSVMDFGVLRIELQGAVKRLEGRFRLVGADINFGTLEVNLCLPCRILRFRSLEGSHASGKQQGQYQRERLIQKDTLLLQTEGVERVGEVGELSGQHGAEIKPDALVLNAGDDGHSSSP